MKNVNHPEDHQKPSADELLRRIRSNMKGGSPNGEKWTPESPDSNERADAAGENRDRADFEVDSSGTTGREFSLEEFYGFTPLVSGTRSNPGPRAKNEERRRPTRKKIRTEEKKPSGENRDYDLMSIFGMEDRRDDPAGSYEADSLLDEEETDEPQLLLSRRRFTEYTDRSQREGIIRGYRKSLILRIADLLLGVLLLVIAVGLEYSELLPFRLPAIFSFTAYPSAAVFWELQLLVLAIVLKYKDYFRGGLGLLTFRISPESVLFLTLTLTALYDLISFWSSGAVGFYLGLSAVLSSLFYSIHSLMMLVGEIRSFRIASSKAVKKALYRMTNEESKLESTEMKDYLPYGNKYLAVTGAEQIDGFYKNLYTVSRIQGWCGFLLLIPILLSLGFGLYGYFGTGSLSEGFSLGMLTLMLTLPASVYFFYSFPYYRLTAHAVEEDSAVIGVAATESTMAPANITLSDVDIFSLEGVRLDKIKLYGSMAYDKVLQYAAAVLCPTGGALGQVLDSIFEAGVTEDMEYLSVTEDGIEAAVEGRHVRIGSYHYIVRSHLLMPDDNDSNGKIRSKNCVDMYMAVDSEVVAKLELSYRPIASFPKTLDRLFESGMTVVVKTFDPNIDLSMLCRILGLSEKMPIKVIHTTDPLEPYEIRDRVDSPVVTLGGIRNLMKTLNSCARCRHMMSIGIALSVISMVTAAVVMGVVLSISGIDRFPTYYIALYQLFWLIPELVLVRIFS